MLAVVSCPAIKKMADWAKETGIKKSGKFENIEVTEKLPPFWLED